VWRILVEELCGGFGQKLKELELMEESIGIGVHVGIDGGINI